MYKIYIVKRPSFGSFYALNSDRRIIVYNIIYLYKHRIRDLRRRGAMKEMITVRAKIRLIPPTLLCQILHHCTIFLISYTYALFSRFH